MIYGQAYTPIKSLDQVEIEITMSSDDVEKGKRVKINYDLGLKYYGDQFRTIDNLMLCQGQLSIEKNRPMLVDRRGSSSDPELVRAYKKEGGLFREDPIKPENKGYHYPIDENGLIETYFDVAYEVEGFDGTKGSIVGDHYYPGLNVIGAILKEQSEYVTRLENIAVGNFPDQKMKVVV